MAQQYLPEALQGRVFYQPGELGHERGIKAEVERRREAQLAAMLEGAEGFGAAEVLHVLHGGEARAASATGGWRARSAARASGSRPPATG